jgi:hypothetical protein
MALLTTQSPSVQGTAPTYGAVSASDTIIPDVGMFLIVKNASGTADTVTIVIPGNDRVRVGDAGPHDHGPDHHGRAVDPHHPAHG